MNQTEVWEFVLLGFSDYPMLEPVLFAIFLLIYLLILLGNIGIIILAATDSHLHTPMYFFLQNLAFLNLCYTTAVIPKMLSNMILTKKSISYHMCMAQTYISLFMGAAECILLAVMAFDRFLAVCHPLRYTIIMNIQSCIRILAASWTASFLVSVVPLYLSLPPLCAPYVINHVFCEAPVLLHMICTNTSLNELLMLVGGLGTLMLPFILILISYGYIIAAIMRIHSISGRWKTFSTCSSHLTVVIIYYGSGMFIYMKPKSSYSPEHDKLISVFYSVINPLLNPIIYSFRNKEVKESLRRAFGINALDKSY
ncbi:olfactory receptor 2G3-like [Crotalus tigris]|uniref:olfactory receptor 2G3-like n=1 Tax=Crotalus tigris TaxID=88082 RepID=UPI00192F56B8|nr:olfactory receptor 2G3-like [Crotalus tigris]XP_039174392.1 olfactory receptor 2G3-like [Crotalus tigris]XP_039174393.1 olfactory receptor 2G3-like [Crotalus tigris]